MHHLDDFGLDVDARGALVCPPCERVTVRAAGPVHVLALESIHRQEILLMLDAPLRAALRAALDLIDGEDLSDRAPRPRLHASRSRSSEESARAAGAAHSPLL